MDDSVLVNGHPSDQVLVARVAARDVEAFGLLYDRYSQPIYTMAVHMVGPAEAEEVVQEVFLRLWNKGDQFDPGRGPFSHWFMSIARNHLLDRLRARTDHQRVMAAQEIDDLLADAPDPEVDVEEEVWLHERGYALLRALQSIPPEQRRVIVLAYFGDLTQAAIADYLGLPLGTVKKRIRLGLQKLRVSLSAQGLEARFSKAGSTSRGAR